MCIAVGDELVATVGKGQGDVPGRFYLRRRVQRGAGEGRGRKIHLDEAARRGGGGARGRVKKEKSNPLLLLYYGLFLAVLFYFLLYYGIVRCTKNTSWANRVWTPCSLRAEVYCQFWGHI